MPSLWGMRSWIELWNRRPWNRSSHPPPPQTPSQVHHVVLKHKYVVALFLFLVCVDLIEIVGVLCYQLFTASYFPWHLYPMMLNRAMEIIALICSRGYIPSLYSAAQILLSLLSLAVYAKRQPCGKYRCAVPLVLYSILLSYETFVAVMVIKVSRMPMANDEGHIIANWPTFQVSPLTGAPDQRLQQPLGMQIMLRDSEDANVHESSAAVSDEDKFQSFGDPREVIVAVQQPDGEKFAIAKICEEPFVRQVTPPGDELFHGATSAVEVGGTEVIQICHEFEQLPGIPLATTNAHTSNSLREIMTREENWDDNSSRV